MKTKNQSAGNEIPVNERIKRNFALCIVLLCAAVFLVLRLYANVRQLTFNGVFSDGTVKVSDRKDPDWMTVGFDDSDWDFAPAPHFKGSEIPWLGKNAVPSLAAPIWNRENSPVVFFRKTFDLDRKPGDKTEIHIVCDDDYILYINGAKIAENEDQMTTHEGERMPLESYLRQGRNLIAIEGINRGLNGNLTFHLLVQGANVRRDRDWKPLSRSAIMAGSFALCIFIAMLKTRGDRIRKARMANAKWIVVLMGIWIIWILGIRRSPLYYQDNLSVYTSTDWLRVACMVLTGAAILFASAKIASSEKIADSTERFGTRGMKWIVWGLFIAALGMRLHRYDSIPPGIFQDDASFMLIGESLWKSEGVCVWSDDMNGNATLMSYWNGLVQYLTGRTTLTLRLAPGFIGAISIPIAAAVMRGVVPAPLIGIFCFLMAFSHYHINYSRIPWDAVMTPLFSILAFWSFCKGLDSREKKWNFFLTGVFLALGLYGYAGFRIVPAIILGMACLNMENLRRFIEGKGWLFFAAGFLIVISPLVMFFMANPGKFSQRTQLVDIFATIYRYYDPLPLAVQSLKTLLMILFQGDSIACRHNTPGAPALDAVTGALFMIGLTYLFSARRFDGLFGNASAFLRQTIRQSMIVWLLIGTIGSSVTFESPHFSRSINLLFPVLFVSATGFLAVISAFTGMRRRMLIGSLAMVIGYLNYDTYFHKKLMDPGVYEDCGYGSRALGERFSEILRETPGACISVSSDLDYSTTNQIKWLHPELAKRRSYTLASSEIARERLKCGNSKLHWFASGKDYSGMAAKQMADAARHIHTDPHGNIIFVEYLFDWLPQDLRDRKSRSATLDSASRGLMRRVFANSDGTGDVVFEDAGYPTRFRYQDESEKPYSAPFSIRYTGFIKCPETGIYGFRTVSDDGSSVVIGGDLIVDNSGEHGSQEKNGFVEMDPGYHPIEIFYFDDRWGAEFSIDWMRPGMNEWEAIPPELLVH